MTEPLANEPLPDDSLGVGEPDSPAPASPPGNSAQGRGRDATLPEGCVTCPIKARYDNGARQFHALKAQHEAAIAPRFIRRHWHKIPRWLQITLSMTGRYGGVACFAGFATLTAMPKGDVVLYPAPIINISPPGAVESVDAVRFLKENDITGLELTIPLARDRIENAYRASQEQPDASD